MLFLSVLYFFRIKKRDLAVNMAMGLSVVIVIQYVITAKHYAFYYLTPMLMLTVFIGFMVYLFFDRLFPKSGKCKIPELILVFFATLLILNVVPKAKSQLAGVYEGRKMHLGIRSEFEPYLIEPIGK